MLTTPEELRELADRLLAEAKEGLARDKTIVPYCMLVHRDDSRTLMGIDGRIMNDDAAKSALFAEIRRRVIDEQIQATILVTDIFQTKIPIALREAVRGMTASEVAAFGLGKREEALLVTAETPLYVLLLRQVYERIGETGIVFGKLDVLDSLDPNFREFSGRTNFFREQAKRA